MGRGRQKAKQQKIARKLKYLTTDTDYDELAKELNAHELEQESVDPQESTESYEGNSEYLNEDTSSSNQDETDDDLDEYAKWAAESAAKAMSNEKTSSSSNAHSPIHHHIPMPVPDFMHKHSEDKQHSKYKQIKIISR